MQKLYDWDDVRAGNCTPDQVWTQKITAPDPAPEPTAPAIPYDPTDPAAAKRHAARIAAEQIALWERLAKGGDIDASKEARQWADRQARLLGLDASTKVEVDVNPHRTLRQLPTAELERMLIEGEFTRDDQA